MKTKGRAKTQATTLGGGEQEHFPHAEVKLCLATVMEAEQGGTMGDQDRLEKFDETFRTGQQGQQGGQPHEERQQESTSPSVKTMGCSLIMRITWSLIEKDPDLS
jgi:hypothetical protein